MNIRPVYSIPPIGSTYEPKEQKRDGPPPPSEELLAISEALKEALEGLSAWIQLYPLMRTLRKTIFQGSEEEETTVSCRELTRLGAIFQNAHAELTSYNRQIPEPSDIALGFEMQKALEQTFTIEIAQETACSFPGFGSTSWGELLLSEKEIEWTPPFLDALFRDISSGNWKRVRQFIHSLRDFLP